MPKFSVIVPTHDTRWLREAVASALSQTEADLEVIIVPNGGAKLGDASLPEDPRIRVVPYGGADGVGAVKRFAFGAATGGILVELDHDDLLAPDALAEVGKTIDGGADFAYSNFAVFHDGSPEPAAAYEPYWGWKSRDAEISGRRVRERISFDPDAASMGHVWYAPNHVRAWTRAGYERAGAHDNRLKVCDDHDLLVRTYLTGSMARIDKCLYLYREHGGNTYVRMNAQVQEATHSIYAKSIDALVLRWAAGRSLPCLDLGAAHNSPKGWVGVDLEGAPVKADLRRRWPWEDSSVGAFRAYDFLEHLPDKQHTVSEIHRCLAPGGWLLSFTPSALGQGAFMDPTHCSYWVRNSWYYYTRRELAKYIKNEGVRFIEHRLTEDYPSDWHAAENIPYVTFDGVAVKDGYDGPGAHDF